METTFIVCRYNVTLLLCLLLILIWTTTYVLLFKYLQYNVIKPTDLPMTKASLSSPLSTPLTSKHLPLESIPPPLEAIPPPKPPKNTSTATKLITYYNKPVWVTPQVFDKCEYKCELISSTKYWKTKVVIFHAPDYPSSLVPLKKYPGQVWVFHSMEPPFLVPNFKSWRRLFNWTLSYRRDTDIFNPYFTFSKKPYLNDSAMGYDGWENKTSSMGWIVSHCGVPSKRLAFGKKLDKYFDIDIYGRCGKLKCPREQWQECFQKNKFYASFENSLCEDYVTEKAFLLFARNVNSIPVTRGAPNYSIYLPPGSYVNTDDFSSAKDLGNFLKSLSNNKEEYMKYFQWRRFYKAARDIEYEFCELCKMVHNLESKKHKRIYQDIDEWVRRKTLPRKSCRDVNNYID